MTGRDPVFVAALGVDDLLLLDRLGLEPVGVVLGYSLHAGDRSDPTALPASLASAAQELGSFPAGEDVARTAATESAWGLCLGRLLAQAEDLHADGVVGVGIRVVALDGGERVSVTAQGTAVRTRADAEGLVDGHWRTDSTGPFTTTLSGRDIWLLVETGYRPLGIALGVSNAPALQPGDLTADGEHARGTQAVYDARDRALARMRAEAEALGADGVVGVRVDGLPTAPDADATRVVAHGDAVRRLRDRPRPPEPQLVLPLLGGDR